MAGTECDPAISTHTQSLGACAKPWPLIGQMSLSLASDWLMRPPLRSQYWGLSLHARRGSIVQLCMTQAVNINPGEIPEILAITFRETSLSLRSCVQTLI